MQALIVLVLALASLLASPVSAPAAPNVRFCFGGGPCDDGNACTTGDRCHHHVCEGGPPRDCDDGNVCDGIETCDPSRGCVAGRPLVCDDDNPCTVDACDADQGCTHTPLSCDDDNVCTLDTCNGSGGCTHTSVGCDDQNPCTDDLCDSDLGCLHANNSASCDDNNACTTNDVCNGGTCVGGNRASGCGACQAVATIPAQGGTFVGTTSGSSSLSGGCATTNNSPERVYAWTPISSGTAAVATCGAGTGYDTVVYMRRDSCTGTQVVCNDDNCTNASGLNRASRLTPTVTAGVTYFIVVDGYNGAAGPFTLTVTPPSTCGNGVREGSEACDGGDAGGCVTGQCTTSCTCVPPASGLVDLAPAVRNVQLVLNSTVASGDVAEGCAESTSGVDLLRFTTDSRNLGTADLVLGNPHCPSPCTDHPLEVCGNPEYICSPAEGHNHAHYSNYARYELLDANGQQLVLGHKQGFCLEDNSSCTDPTYTCSNQGITAGCSDTYSSSLGCQYLDVTDVPSGNYTLRVRLDPFDRIAELDESNNTVAVPVSINRGTGTCANPIAVAAAGGTFSGTTSGASAQTGTCTTTNTSPEKVYKWTPSTSGTATIKTCGSGTDYDSVVYVRSGSCASGSQVACNDDACTNSTGQNRAARVTPSVTAGTTYYIFVDGYSGASGDYTLTITPP